MASQESSDSNTQNVSSPMSDNGTVASSERAGSPDSPSVGETALKLNVNSHQKYWRPRVGNLRCIWPRHVEVPLFAQTLELFDIPPTTLKNLYPSLELPEGTRLSVEQ